MKKLMLVLNTCFLLSMLLPSIISLEGVPIISSSTYTTKAYTKIWKYMDIQGRLHKRLWNTATQQWETKWIPV